MILKSENLIPNVYKSRDYQALLILLDIVINTSKYEIEHIIPQSRYFDDSFSNKVICEAEVNKLKDNMLGYEFIKKHGGEEVQLCGGKRVKIFTVGEYEQFVSDH